MATKVRDRWIVCDDYAAGPYTEEGAPGALDSLERYVAAEAAKPGRFPCRLPHRIVVSATKPVTVAERVTLQAQATSEI